MVLAISAALSGANDPQAVQLGVTGLTAGVEFTVTGATTTWSWTVPGGNGQEASGTTAVLADILAPIGVASTYTVEQAGSSAASSPVTVTMVADGDVALQSLDGQSTVAGDWIDTGDGREQSARVALFQIPGRSAPVVRWDVASADSGTMILEVEGEASATLRSLVGVGAPLLIRTNGATRDVDPVMVVVVTKAPRSLVGAVGTRRAWSIGYQVIEYPDLSSLLSASDWDDFDAAWAALDWDDFDSYFAGLTWDDYDLIDWTTF